MRIDTHTKLITLIGKPLGQSFAARMQNEGYEAAGLNMLYFYTEADEAALPEVLAGVRAMPFAGCAVTKPNKVAVMRYADEYDPLCLKMGASNTLVKLPDGRLKAYNTDGCGARRSLTEQAGDLKDRTVLCFGAGGAGRSVCFELADAGVRRLYIADITDACETVSAGINAYYPNVCAAVSAADTDAVRTAAREADIILNLSGAGMRGRVNETPIDKTLLTPRHICFDATYNPAETRFLREAREAGCAKVINGLDMSLYQGARQIELWTGRQAPVEAMRQTLFDILAGE